MKFLAATGRRHGGAVRGQHPGAGLPGPALASIAREWPNVLHASFEIVLRGKPLPGVPLRPGNVRGQGYAVAHRRQEGS
jgi:hypothetical protein